MRNKWFLVRVAITCTYGFLMGMAGAQLTANPFWIGLFHGVMMWIVGCNEGNVTRPKELT